MSRLSSSKMVVVSVLLFIGFGPVGAKAENEPSKKSIKSVNASPEELSSEKYTFCRGSSKSRTIKVVQKKNGCQTIYSKDGDEKVMATAASVDVCNGVLAKIQKNLEENSWSCQDISDSRISSF